MPALTDRIEGGVGGTLLTLFVALSFDLALPWLLLAAAAGAGVGAVLAPHGADAHPPPRELGLLPSAASSDYRGAAPAPVGLYRFSYVVQSAYLIGSLLWRGLTPAYEWELRGGRIATIGADILVIAGLIAIHRHVPKALFWIALVAGLGLLGIRVTETGWRTGHLTYTLAAR